MRRITLTTVLLSALCACAAEARPAADAVAVMPLVKGGQFASVLPPAPGVKQVVVRSYRLDRTPVTNAEFASFVSAHPEWRRDRVAAVFAEKDYLAHWTFATEPGAAIARQPVVRVSWFAASAYCESRGARLPTWYQWEYAAAASATKADARSDAEWQRQILDWYSRSGRGALPNVGGTPANIYGIQDLHGVVWEWVYDLSSLLVSGDNREQSDPDALRFCGEGALTMEQKENYAILMRIAMLSSMQARYTSGTMGFRCAEDVGP
jgi:formylglycine-generating enzyme required for sulfatase activity